MATLYSARDFRVNVPERRRVSEDTALSPRGGRARGARPGVAIGLEVVGARHVDAPALKALEAMLKHRPVDFLHYVEAHGDLEVRRDADEVTVEGGVVELAERETVGNDRLAQGMAVREDVSGFQQLVMAEPADGAALLVSAEHALAKAPLVQALPDHRGHVLSPRGQRRRVIDLPGGRRPDLVIDRHDEAQGFGMVLDDEDRPRRFVEALDDAMEIDERGLPLHGRP